MKALVILLLSSVCIFGQQMAPKDIFKTPERKRFINTCNLFAEKLMDKTNNENFSQCFTITLSEDNLTELNTFKKELAFYNDSAINYTIAQDAKDNKIFTITFDLGTDKKEVKKIFVLFNTDDDLIDDFMVIAQGTQIVSEDTAIDQTETPIVILPAIVDSKN